MSLPRPLVPCLVSALWLGASGAASAACPSPYTVDNLLSDLMTVEGALRTSDDATATKGATQLENGLGCMNEVLPRAIAGRAYRAVGAGLVVGGQEEQGEKWLRTAAELEQSFDFGIEDLPDPHPVRAAYATAKSTSSGEPTTLPGSWNGTGYVDGKKLEQPMAREDRMHVVQLEGPSGGIQSWIVTGSAFPPAALTAPTVADSGKGEKAPKGEKPPKPDKVKEPKPGPVASAEPVPDPSPAPKPAKVRTQPAPVSSDPTAVVTASRNRPPEKTPLLIGGAAITLGGGGVLYYLAYHNAQAFQNEATSSEVVQSSWKSARLFTIASLSVAAVGAGTFTWGVILDGGGTPLPALQLRF